MMLSLPPLSLYVHIPWCVQKCPYCDFNSHQVNNELPEESYINALMEDLNNELIHVQDRKLHSIFFGGGTPSIFSATSIHKILQGIASRIEFSKEIEITLEANPGTVDFEKFQGFYAGGVNRLSIGIQSFNSQHLEGLGRIHSDNEAINAVKTAQAAGFQQINIDLMHGLEKQKTSQALFDLQQAINLKVQHISWYQLTIEPNTVFYKQPPVIPQDEELEAIQNNGEALLTQHHYQRYEISAFSQENCQSKHNKNYWQFGDYIGIGAGAHGKITDLKNHRIIRNWKTRLPKDYLNTDKHYLAGKRFLEKDELPLEFMMNALRLSEGFQKEIFEKHTGLSYKLIDATIKQLIDKQLLEYHHQENIKTTDLGNRFLDSILAEF